MSMDPDPGRVPDLEAGGGVRPGATPPETSQTSGLSAPEPRTRNSFPPTGIAAVVVAIVIAVLFLVAAVGLVLAL
ncbi:hypothetical protein BJY24_004961 [Nocardia transvalensis]|uniref:Uncharacterized protein n=1 Tax=Nocardia transvalensis TaxID=37333 RepID=A0A7W9PI61_9NOCA|nr:DUF6480 family protein [Nocardia transvalensis]MBB5916049.1 hypothetical protein [Nocardia transvalensis]